MSERFELSRVRVTEGKITVIVSQKSRGNRFELARVQVIGSQLYNNSSGSNLKVKVVLGLERNMPFP